MPTERRNLTALGRKRRREFDRSIQKLRDLGMPDWAVEYYRRAARIAGLPPHMVVCHLAIISAGRQMQTKVPDTSMAEDLLDDQATPEESADRISPVAPSYESVQTLRSRINGLWREIQRHSALPETADERAADGAEPTADDSVPATVTRLRTGASARARTGTRSRRR